MNAEQSHTISQVGDNTTPEAAVAGSKSMTSSASSIPGYNMRCPAVKRLMREAAELSIPEVDFAAQPTESNLFEWHFTMKGPESSEFENGVYHGRIIFPSEYPMKPPSFILLTPNGRFQTEEKICLSISNYHPETWLPSWSIRTALVALRSFMTTPGNEGAIGSLNFPPEERKKLAKKSRTWECRECGLIVKLLPSQTEQVDATKRAKVEASPTIVATGSSTPNADVADIVQTKTANVGIPVDNEHSTINRHDPIATTATAATLVTSGIPRTDNQQSGSSGFNRNEVRPSESETDAQQQQPHEPIKNILYDFGIACFVILILALCLRRLLVIFNTL